MTTTTRSTECTATARPCSWRWNWAAGTGRWPLRSSGRPAADSDDRGEGFVGARARDRDGENETGPAGGRAGAELLRSGSRHVLGASRVGGPRDHQRGGRSVQHRGGSPATSRQDRPRGCDRAGDAADECGRRATGVAGARCACRQSKPSPIATCSVNGRRCARIASAAAIACTACSPRRESRSPLTANFLQRLAARRCGMGVRWPRLLVERLQREWATLQAIDARRRELERLRRARIRRTDDPLATANAATDPDCAGSRSIARSPCRRSCLRGGRFRMAVSWAPSWG